MSRKALSKRLRFEVFKRDGFVCRYCGAQPPGVLLVIDHIVPLARGGTDDPMNLQTACEACNQGKSDIPLGELMPRPDPTTDLRYLEIQQEAMELRRYEERLAAQEALRAQVVSTIQTAFDEILERDWVPGDRLVNQMLDKYAVVIVYEAARVTARALDQRRVAGYTTGAGTAWVRYMWAVARNLNEDEIADAGGD